jgi:hypothetical protein
MAWITSIAVNIIIELIFNNIQLVINNPNNLPKLIELIYAMSLLSITQYHCKPVISIDVDI